MIVEVEAYHQSDPASHSFHGKTERNKIMFGEGGHLYVYFTYGMHFCANVVTGRQGTGEAVLIRAVEPMSGIEVMIKNRYGNFEKPLSKSSNLNSSDPKFITNLTNGPAKFCKAFGITGNQNGLDLIKSNITISEGRSIPPNLIGISTRIGINTATEKKWRFYLKDNPWVSKKNPK